jgi:hypothetical protein
MKEIISKVSITAFLLSYLFICGTLYLVGYWSTFDFDITNYIELLDIPKSFVFPLLTGIGISTVSILVQGIIRLAEKLDKDQMINKPLLVNIKEVPTKTLLFRILVDVDFWAVIILSAAFYFYSPRRAWVFAIVSTTLVIYSIAKYLRSSVIARLIPNQTVRLFTSILLFFVPIFSFSNGKLNAIAIWKNQKYFKIADLTFKEGKSGTSHLISAKLLGKLGTTIFLSDSANGRLTILNLETVQSVEFQYIDNLK